MMDLLSFLRFSTRERQAPNYPLPFKPDLTYSGDYYKMNPSTYLHQLLVSVDHLQALVAENSQKPFCELVLAALHPTQHYP